MKFIILSTAIFIFFCGFTCSKKMPYFIKFYQDGTEVTIDSLMESSHPRIKGFHNHDEFDWKNPFTFTKNTNFRLIYSNSDTVNIGWSYLKSVIENDTSFSDIYDTCYISVNIIDTNFTIVSQNPKYDDFCGKRKISIFNTCSDIEYIIDMPCENSR